MEQTLPSLATLSKKVHSQRALSGRQAVFLLQHLVWDPQLFQLHILLQLTKVIHIKNLPSKFKAEKQEKGRYVRNGEIQ